MKAIPLRYLPWMIRDLALGPGAVVVAVLVLSWLIMGRIDPPPAVSSGPGMVAGALGQLSLPLLLYCSAAIVSNDRVHGYYRSFFSRPLSPPWYYFTRWLLGGIVFVLIGPALTLGLVLAIGTFPLSGELMIQLALSYFLLGGLILFFSTFMRYDWLFGVLVLVMQGVLFALHRNGVNLPAIWDFVLTILPPIYQASLNSPLPTGPALTHILLYGGGLVVAALVLLRLRPLGAGGRS
jgi:hypothetical protein